MDLNELYKEIEKAEIDLNAKRLKYIKEALVENGGSIKLKFKKWGEDNNAFDFDDQFPVIIEIAGIPMFLTEVYVKKNDFRMVLLDYDDMTLGDFFGSLGNENFYVCQPLSFQKSSQEIEKVNPLYAFKLATAYFRGQGMVPVFEDCHCRLVKL